jgi:hypothetical protein
MSDTAIAEAPAELIPTVPPGPEAIEELKADGLSNYAVADVIGVDEKTVRRKIAAFAASEDEITNDGNGSEHETAANAAPAVPEEMPVTTEEMAAVSLTTEYEATRTAVQQAMANPEPPAEAMRTEPAVPSADARAALEIEHPIGPVRQGVLDHLIDSEGPQTVAQIIAGLGNYTRGTIEAAILREYRSGRIERVAPGTYRLAPAKPPEQPKQPSSPPPPTPDEEAMWLAAFEAWVINPESWDCEVLGPRPDEPGRRIPADIVAKGVDRSRKRKERRKEAEIAAAKRAAADAELRDRLIGATGGNIIRGPGIEDVSPIQLAMQLVPLERILSAVRSKTDKKLFPGNEPATSWREERLLKEIAESYTRTEIVPNLVAAWSKAGQAPAPKTQSSPAAGDTPDDIDELRRRHDSPSAPPGPHSLPYVPMPAPANATDTSEAPAAVSAPLEQKSAPASSPPQPGAMPDDRPAIDAESAAVDAEPRAAPAKEAFQTTPCGSPAKPPKPPAEPTRESIMAAFNRPRQPQPAPPQHQPAQRQPERPWFAGERQAAPEPLSDAAVDELVAGWKAGNLAWPRKLLGEEPGHPDCRVSRAALRRNGL